MKNKLAILLLFIIISLVSVSFVSARACDNIWKWRNHWCPIVPTSEDFREVSMDDDFNFQVLSICYDETNTGVYYTYFYLDEDKDVKFYLTSTGSAGVKLSIDGKKVATHGKEAEVVLEKGWHYAEIVIRRWGHINFDVSLEVNDGTLSKIATKAGTMEGCEWDEDKDGFVEGDDYTEDDCDDSDPTIYPFRIFEEEPCDGILHDCKNRQRFEIDGESREAVYNEICEGDDNLATCESRCGEWGETITPDTNRCCGDDSISEFGLIQEKNDDETICKKGEDSCDWGWLTTSEAGSGKILTVRRDIVKNEDIIMDKNREIIKQQGKTKFVPCGNFSAVVEKYGPNNCTVNVDFGAIICENPPLSTELVELGGPNKDNLSIENEDGVYQKKIDFYIYLNEDITATKTAKISAKADNKLTYLLDGKQIFSFTKEDLAVWDQEPEVFETEFKYGSRAGWRHISLLLDNWGAYGGLEVWHEIEGFETPITDVDTAGECDNIIPLSEAEPVTVPDPDIKSTIYDVIPFNKKWYVCDPEGTIRLDPGYGTNILDEFDTPQVETSTALQSTISLDSQGAGDTDSYIGDGIDIDAVAIEDALEGFSIGGSPVSASLGSSGTPGSRSSTEIEYDAFMCYKEGDMGSIGECCGNDLGICFNKGILGLPKVRRMGEPLSYIVEVHDLNKKKHNTVLQIPVKHKAREDIPPYTYSIPGGDVPILHYTNWKGFKALEFYFASLRPALVRLIIKDTNEKEHDFGPILKYAIENKRITEDGELAPSQQMRHIYIPIDGELGEVDKGNISEIIFTARKQDLPADYIETKIIDKMDRESYNVWVFDRMHLTYDYETESEKNKYCSFTKEWVYDFDVEDNEANPICNQIPSFTWTGTQCCGDDIVYTDETYEDESGGCWKGNFIADDTTLMEIEFEHDTYNGKHTDICRGTRCEYPILYQDWPSEVTEIGDVSTDSDFYNVRITNTEDAKEATISVEYVPQQILFFGGAFRGCAADGFEDIIDAEHEYGYCKVISGSNHFCSYGSKFAGAFNNGKPYWSSESSGTAPSYLRNNSKELPGDNTDDHFGTTEINPDHNDKGCCPADYCWNGTVCVEGIEEPFSISNYESSPEAFTKKFSYNNPTADFDMYVCYKEDAVANWNKTHYKEDWYDSADTAGRRIGRGYCMDGSQCWTSAGCKDNGWYTNEERGYFSVGNEMTDRFCENGNWSTRTKLIALELLNFVKDKGDYTLFCDTNKNALNFYTDSWKPINEDTNNFCVLVYKENNDADVEKKVAVGTSLNKPIEAIKQVLLNEGVLKGDTTLSICTDAPATEDSVYGTYVNCDGSTDVEEQKLWYNAKTESLIYSAHGINLQSTTIVFADFMNLLFNPIMAFTDIVINIIRPQTTESPTNIPVPVEYWDLFQSKDFKTVYLEESGDMTVRGIIEQTTRGKKYLAIDYENSPVDICSAISLYNKKIGGEFTCQPTINNSVLTYRIASETTDMIVGFKVWKEITAKIRSIDFGSELGDTGPGAVVKDLEESHYARKYIKFEAEENEEVLSYYWDLNVTSTEEAINGERFGRKITHYYEGPGDYTVTLITIGNDGSYSTDSIDIEVTEEPVTTG